MWPYPTIVVHRGGGRLAPENTLAALRCGWAHGFSAVEFDVMLSQDGVPVLMHDEQLGRTVPGSGNISKKTMEQLVALDAGVWFGAEFAGEPVPTLEQAYAFCMQHSIWMNIEIKPAAGWDEETGRIVAQSVSQWLSDRNDVRAMPLFSSFSFDALMAARLAAPGIPRGYLVDRLPDDWLQKLQLLDAVALHANHRHLSRVQVRAVKQAGYGLFCYTVNDAERAIEILSWGVDAFCTDCIDIDWSATLST